MEPTIWAKALNDAIRSAEKLLRRPISLRNIRSDHFGHFVQNLGIPEQTQEVKVSSTKDDLSSAFFDRISQEIDNILKGGFNYEVGIN